MPFGTFRKKINYCSNIIISRIRLFVPSNDNKIIRLVNKLKTIFHIEY